MGILEKILARLRGRKPEPQEADRELSPVPPEDWTWPENREEILRALHAMARDNARTPMQWSAERNAGFTEGEPWIRINPNYREINAADQVGREDSVYGFYRKLVALRKEHPVFAEGDFEPLLEEDGKLWAYRRRSGDEELLVLCNLSSDKVKIPLSEEEMEGELLICSLTERERCGASEENSEPALQSDNSAESRSRMLAPWEGRMLLRRR